MAHAEGSKCCSAESLPFRPSNDAVVPRKVPQLRIVSDESVIGRLEIRDAPASPLPHDRAASHNAGLESFKPAATSTMPTPQPCAGTLVAQFAPGDNFPDAQHAQSAPRASHIAVWASLRMPGKRSRSNANFLASSVRLPFGPYSKSTPIAGKVPWQVVFTFRKISSWN